MGYYYFSYSANADPSWFFFFFPLKRNPCSFRQKAFRFSTSSQRSLMLMGSEPCSYFRIPTSGVKGSSSVFCICCSLWSGLFHPLCLQEASEQTGSPATLVTIKAFSLICLFRCAVWLWVIVSGPVVHNHIRFFNCMVTLKYRSCRAQCV